MTDTLDFWGPYMQTHAALFLLYDMQHATFAIYFISHARFHIATCGKVSSQST